ncbi:hypothetical protein FBU30_006098 [Linnemannia zychae]|nr:hypothetical protein FBU30_006098 [Linnemannia zychae]
MFYLMARQSEGDMVMVGDACDNYSHQAVAVRAIHRIQSVSPGGCVVVSFVSPAPSFESDGPENRYVSERGLRRNIGSNTAVLVADDMDDSDDLTEIDPEQKDTVPEKTSADGEDTFLGHSLMCVKPVYKVGTFD